MIVKYKDFSDSHFMITFYYIWPGENAKKWTKSMSSYWNFLKLWSLCYLFTNLFWKEHIWQNWPVEIF
jgi:hypothetical protein